MGRALVPLALLALAPAAAAQERSPTGRHRPPPDPPPAAAAPVSAAGRWWLALGAGVADGGDLVRVQTLDDLPYPWAPETGGGFRTARFKTSLEPGPALALTAGRRLGRRLGLRADLAWSRGDVAAEASLGEQGAVHRFDRWGILSAGLALEVRLTTGPAHPYAAAGLTVVRLDPDAATDLAQTNWGGRLALGWRQPLDRRLALRLEAWAGRTGFAAGSWRPTAERATQPQVAVTAAEALTTAGLSLAVAVTLDP